MRWGIQRIVQGARAQRKSHTEVARERFVQLLDEAVDTLITSEIWNEETKSGCRQLLQALKMQITQLRKRNMSQKKDEIFSQELEQIDYALLIIKMQKNQSQLREDLNRVRENLNRLIKEEQTL